MKDLKIGKKTLVASLIGTFLGIIFFFNLPALGSFILQTLVLALIFGALGFGVENFSLRFVGSLTLLFMAVGVFLFSTINCIQDIWDRKYPPAKNPMTGEVEAGEFDGFRWMNCDKGNWPWYFNEVDFSDVEMSKEEYCRKNPDNGFCQRMEAKSQMKNSFS